MPRLLNIAGPDFRHIKSFSHNFAVNGELTHEELLTFEKVLKLAVECTQIDMKEVEAAKLMQRVSNPLRDAIGCPRLDIAPLYGEAKFVIVPDVA